ncbi:MAG: LpxI family protein [Myxococcales bacterium]|nr:LpxI family protein [Myxococcales bacterium]
MKQPAPLGLLAGGGRLPILAAQAVAAAGRPVVGLQLAETGQKGLLRHCAAGTTLSLGKVGAIVDFYRQHGVAEVLVVGKVEKKLNFAEIEFDALALEVLATMAGRQDSSIFAAVADIFESHDMHVARQTDVLSSLLAPEGHLAGPVPSERIAADIALGFSVASVVADYDIGQTVAVKQGVVVAVEAFEHTDACIRRAARLAGKGQVICKAARSRQDTRFDVPAVGPATLRQMGKAGASCLALEAGWTLWLDQEICRAEAARLNISIVGVTRRR